MPPLALRNPLLAVLAVAAAAAVLAPSSGGDERAVAQLTASSVKARSLPAKGFRPTPSKTASKAKPRPAASATAVTGLVPNDPLWGASWSLAKVRAPLAWRLTTGSPDIVVAVLDTGIEASHPDLAGAVLPGWDTVNEDSDASDGHGHGTAVAGVIAARGNNGLGSAGVCWRCSLLPVKVIGDDGSGSATDVAEGIVWAADHGAAVINLSFVLSGYDGGVAGAIDYARSRGALVVAAAGNSGGGEPTFPASHPGVIGVTATDGSDARYGWASHGSWVALAAPGCSQSTALGGAYGDFCGTSSSTAFASGVLGLVRSSAGFDASQAQSAVAESVIRVGDFVASGRVDVSAALARRPVTEPDVSSTPRPADSHPDHLEPHRDLR